MPRTRRKGGGTPSLQQEVESNTFVPNLESLETASRAMITRTAARNAKESSIKPSSESVTSNVSNKPVLDSKKKTKPRAAAKKTKQSSSVQPSPPQAEEEVNKSDASVPEVTEVLETKSNSRTRARAVAKKAMESSVKPSTSETKEEVKQSDVAVQEVNEVLESKSNSRTRAVAKKGTQSSVEPSTSQKKEEVKQSDVAAQEATEVVETKSNSRTRTAAKETESSIKPPLQEVKGNVWLPNQEVLEDTPPKALIRTLAKQKQTKPTKLNTFPARLQWKMAHLAMPATSTPKVDARSKGISKRDIETAFGFDDTPTEMPANYSAFISPIPTATTSQNRLQPVWKVNPLTQRNVEFETPQRTAKERVTVIPTEDKPKQHLKTSEAVVKPLVEEKANAVSAKDTAEHLKASEVVTTKRITRRRVPVTAPREDRVQHDLEVPKAVSMKRKVNEIVEVDSKDDITKHALKAPTKQRRTKAKGNEDKTKLIKAVASRQKPGESAPFVSKTNEGGDSKAPNAVAGGFSEFSQLLYRYKEDDIVEPELRVDPKKIVRTYPSRRKRVKFSEDRESECEYGFIPSAATAFDPEPKQKRKPNSKKDGGLSKKAKTQELDLDDEAKRWMEEKNKEFEDVLKVPLVIVPLSTRTSE
ncbi:unnamed protein product [Orchesella dallaii]|uniref:Uncharacterized protein n=1 Tax=Orchesella dallaii TaxID=48710 RepID=A0ABP1S4H4_9HEXA